MNLKTYLSIVFLFLCFGIGNYSFTQDFENRIFRGTIGAKNMEIHLDKKGVNLYGYYLYEESLTRVCVEGKYKKETPFKLKSKNKKIENSQWIISDCLFTQESKDNYIKGEFKVGKEVIPFYFDELKFSNVYVTTETAEIKHCFSADEVDETIVEKTKVSNRFRDESTWDICSAFLMDYSVRISEAPYEATAKIENFINSKIGIFNENNQVKLSTIDEILEYKRQKIKDSVYREVQFVSSLVTFIPTLTIGLGHRIEIPDEELGYYSFFKEYFYNFDLITGELITLEDILIQGYEERLLALISERSIDLYEVRDLNPDFKISNNFQLIGEGILFFYQNGEIIGLDNQWGETVGISYLELADLWNPNGLLTIFMDNPLRND